MKVIDTETPIKVVFSVRYHLVYVFMDMNPNKQEYLKYKLKKEYKTKQISKELNNIFEKVGHWGTLVLTQRAYKVRYPILLIVLVYFCQVMLKKLYSCKVEYCKLIL